MNLSDLIKRHQKVAVEHFPNQVAEDPMVSVCVQTYQHATFIKKCLDGILLQKTTFDFEILLGEDASTDGTREICIKYAKKYPDKIRLFLHSRKNNISINNRPTGRFNLMYNLDEAKGKYIAMCEGDDYWENIKKLEKQICFLEKNKDFVLSFHDCKVVNEKGLLVKESLIHNHVNLKDTVLENIVGSLPTLTVVFKNFNISLPNSFIKVLNADMFLHTIMGQYGKAIKQEGIEASYRLHSGGIWTSLKEYDRTQEIINTLTLLSTTVKNKFLKQLINQRLTEKKYHLTILLLKRKKIFYFILSFTDLFIKDIKYKTRYTKKMINKGLLKIFNSVNE